MSTPQSIRAFADDARASLAELDKALGSKEAVALLRHGGALDWADAVIPNADLAVERAMLDAPAAADFGAEGRTGRQEKDKRKNDTREQPVGLLPAPKETSKERGSNREASAETQFAARERRTATATKTTTATTATTTPPATTTPATRSRDVPL
jgi:hypothetical protein